MRVTDLINAQRIACCREGTSKKRVLEQLSGLLAASASGVTQGDIFDSLVTRERLGSTGLGGGCAIPHGRIRGLDAPAGAFMKLAGGVDFDAPDGRPVDLVFALLVPEEATDIHLQLLAQLAEMFSDAQFCARLRAGMSSEALFNLLQSWEPRRAPA